MVLKAGFKLFHGGVKSIKNFTHRKNSQETAGKDRFKKKYYFKMFLNKKDEERVDTY